MLKHSLFNRLPLQSTYFNLYSVALYALDLHLCNWGSGAPALLLYFGWAGVFFSNSYFSFLSRWAAAQQTLKHKQLNNLTEVESVKSVWHFKSFSCSYPTWLKYCLYVMAKKKTGNKTNKCALLEERQKQSLHLFYLKIKHKTCQIAVRKMNHSREFHPDVNTKLTFHFKQYQLLCEEWPQARFWKYPNEKKHPTFSKHINSSHRWAGRRVRASS